ncbi:MAG: right-handed parallel beta-helix repeat-containing protein [Deltaproteobacteria bacterium]|nr:right-handed parallel beta-helix repeat-containing protein [Deltaproteobacteria bacterium]
MMTLIRRLSTRAAGVVLLGGLAMAPQSAPAADEAVIDSIQTDVDLAKSKADKNSSEIESLKGGLPAERAAREAAIADLQLQIDSIPAGPPGPPGPPGQDGADGADGAQGPPGISHALCSVTVAASGGDHPSIQDAVDAILPASTPCTILVTPGTYTENVVLATSHIHLMGAGAERTILQALDIGLPALEVTGAVGVEVSGLSIQGPGSIGIRSASSSVVISGSRITDHHSGPSSLDPFPAGIHAVDSELTLERSEIGLNDVGVYAANASGSMTGNAFNGNGGEGAGTLSLHSSNFLLSDNSFQGGEPVQPSFEGYLGDRCTTIIRNNTFAGMEPAIDNQAVGTGGVSCTTVITGNRVDCEGMDQGIRNGGPAIISANTVSGCALHGITTDAAATTIANNHFSDNGGAGGTAVSNLDTVTITGNTFSNSGNDAIQTVNGIASITGNTFLGTSRYGVNAASRSVLMSNLFDGTEAECVHVSAGTVAVAANHCNDVMLVTGTIVVENDLRLDVGGDVAVSAGSDLNVLVGADTTLSSGRNATVDAGLDTVIQSGGDSTVTSGNRTTIHTGSDLTLDTVGSTDVKSGGPIVIKGSAVYP